MAEKIYNWTDDPMVSGVADCNTDVVNDCLMHLKYENTSDAIQNMYETGQVEKQSRAFNQLLSMKHSTFDKSKFEIVGNPVITDDGVASGFVAQSSYIKTASTFDFTSAQSFEITFSITTPNKPAEQPYTGIFSTPTLGNNEYILVGYEFSNNRFVYGIGSSTGTFWNVNSSNLIKPNTKYYIKIKVNGTTIVVQISTDNINWETDASGSLNTSLNLNSSLFFGVGRGQIRPFKGTFDLKSVEVQIDGIPVFSGSVTSIDTIKPDDYTVVGTPTITDDGILTTSSDVNSYVDSVHSIQPITLSNSEKFSIFCKLPKKNAAAQYRVFRIQKIGSADIAANFNLESRLDVGNSGVGFRFVYYESLDNNRLQKILDFQIPEVLNQDVPIKVEYNSTQNLLRIYKYIDNQEILVTSKTLTNPLNYIDENGYFYVGKTNGSSFDLNSIQVWSNGNLIYQPCLKIPYTLSKTGSKIVDVAYRDRVQDMYEQFGYAPYYTLDEENQNFTLPMGEIYGMIERDAKKDGNEIYTGTKTFIQPANSVPVILQHSNATVASPPETVSNIVQDFQDASGKRTGCLYNTINTDGSTSTSIQVIRGDVYNTLGLGIDTANKSTLTHNGNLLRYVDYFFANEWGWCRKWSDGWLEQGGIIPDFGSYSSKVLTFLRPWKHTGYSIVATRGGYNSDNTRTDVGIISMSTANCNIGIAMGSGGGLGRWYACGWDSTAP